MALCIRTLGMTWNLVGNFAASGILPWDKWDISLGAKWVKK
jgi:hypothetical protein